MNIIQSIRTPFGTYKTLAEKAMAQTRDDVLLRPAAEDSNSIVVIVRHLHGNMLSRWTNFLTEDGEKPWRNRDEEFEHIDLTRDDLMQLWEEGWHCLLGTLDGLNEADLDRPVLIRGERMTALDALLRQLAHYCYHVGQIILLCRQGARQWESLSIPKGGSAAFNAALQPGKQP